MERFFIAITLLSFIGVSKFIVTSAPANRTIYKDLNLSSDTNNHTLIFAHIVSRLFVCIECAFISNMLTTNSQIYRHGDRNIVMIYPNDPNKDLIHWPGGYGQLTNVNFKRI